MLRSKRALYSAVLAMFLGVWAGQAQQAQQGGVADYALIFGDVVHRLYLQEQGGRVTAGFAMDENAFAPYTADGSGLVVDEGKLSGTLVWKPLRSNAGNPGMLWQLNGQTNTWTLDLTTTNGHVTGTAKGGFGPAHTHRTLVVSGTRAIPAEPSRRGGEIWVSGISKALKDRIAALGEVYLNYRENLWMRVDFLKDAAVEVEPFLTSGWEPTGNRSFVPDVVCLNGQSISIRDNRLVGTCEIRGRDEAAAVKGYAATVTFSGPVIAGWSAGVARWKDSSNEFETCFISRLPVSPLTRSAVTRKNHPLTWSNTAQPDSNLVQRAKQEASLPIRQCEPGKVPFWNNRLRGTAGPETENAYNCIYAPCFDFEEVPGAVKYRFTVSAIEKYSREYGKVDWPMKKPGPFTFEAEKPWAALTPVWNDLEVGAYWNVEVVGLDAQGKELGQVKTREIKFPTWYHMPEARAFINEKHFKWIETFKAQQGWTDPRNIVTLPRMTKVAFRKRASFEGPYFSALPPARETALRAARWGRDVDCWLGWRGIPGSGLNRGESGRGDWTVMFIDFPLQVARLTTDPRERAEALQMVQRCALLTRQDILADPDHVPLMYHDYTPNNGDLGLALIRAYAATGDERIKEAALLLARGLTAGQLENGAFLTLGADSEGRNGGVPGGVFGLADFPAIDPSRILLFWGQIRRQWKINEFEKNEDLAYRWVLKNSVRDLFWQNVGQHSMEVCAVSDSVAPFALMFVEWLLECAPQGKRDLKLAEELCRWMECRHVQWSRTARAGLMVPRVSGGCHRAAGTSPRIAGEMAVVFAKLAVATKSDMWRAKAEALSQACQMIVHPENGEILEGLMPPCGMLPQGYVIQGMYLPEEILKAPEP